MLLELSIRNLVILERARIEPGAGLTVISGETGAGKSLLLDALGLVLGDRAQARLVGPAGDEATVAAVFQIDAARAERIGAAVGIGVDGGQVIIRRRIGRNGRSQAWFNDEPVGVGALKAAAAELVDVRVQHEHLRLADVARQMDLLDRYGGHLELAAAYAESHHRCLELQAEIEQLHVGEHESLRELDYLRFVVREIDELDPRAGELADLEERQRLLAGAAEWQELAAEAAGVLGEGEQSVSALLASLGRRLAEAPDRDLADAGTACLQALEAVREATLACAGAGDRLEADPSELARIDQRLAAWYDLARKHGGSEEAILSARSEAAERIHRLEHLEDRRGEAARELEAARSERRTRGRELAAARQRAGDRLAQRVGAELAELGMPRARLSVVDAEGEVPTALGLRHQEFHVCTNPGQRPGPLKDVASGGESARLTLALAVALSEVDDVPVLVFDEVDAGVGGRLGARMGAKLRGIAGARSVIAVTHTPQLAAAADRNYLVHKDQGDDATAVSIVELRGEDLVLELAEMLGGGQAARQQAVTLLDESRTTSGTIRPDTSEGPSAP